VYHNRGTQAYNDLVTKTTIIPSYPGFEYIENIKTSKSDQLITVRFPDKKVTTHLTLAAQANTTILTSDGVGASVLERTPLTMVTRYGKTATFVAALEPVRKWQNPTIQNLSHTMEDAQIKVAIQRKNETETLYVLPNGIAHSQKMRIKPSKEQRWPVFLDRCALGCSFAQAIVAQLEEATDLESVRLKFESP
jgi:hypothetical protein